jgi:adenylyl-sulfate kinase
MNHRPATIWLTGLSACGKTTLGRRLADSLRERGVVKLDFLDGDELRKRFDRTYGHSLEDRFAVLQRIVEIARESNEAGNIAIVATVSHKRRMREIARENIDAFMEVYLKCPPEVCTRRDYKGVYRAAALEHEYIAGVTEPYEVSAAPELVLDTASRTVDECSAALLESVLQFVELPAPRAGVVP